MLSLRLLLLCQWSIVGWNIPSTTVVIVVAAAVACTTTLIWIVASTYTLLNHWSGCSIVVG